MPSDFFLGILICGTKWGGGGGWGEMNKLAGCSRENFLGLKFLLSIPGKEPQGYLLQGRTITHILGTKLLYKFYGQTDLSVAKHFAF